MFFFFIFFNDDDDDVSDNLYLYKNAKLIIYIVRQNYIITGVDSVYVDWFIINNWDKSEL